MKNKFSSSISDSLKGRDPAPPSSEEPKPAKDDVRHDEVVKKTTKANTKKHAGGRPTNASKGLITRKQITLTLPPELYADVQVAATEADTSVAKYIERAIKEYRSSRK